MKAEPLRGKRFDLDLDNYKEYDKDGDYIAPEDIAKAIEFLKDRLARRAETIKSLGKNMTIEEIKMNLLGDVDRAFPDITEVKK